MFRLVERFFLRALVVGLTVLVLLSPSVALGPHGSAAPARAIGPLRQTTAPRAPENVAPRAGASPAAGSTSQTSASRAFSSRVQSTAAALAASGVPRQDIRLPYVGTPAKLVNGAVVPGYAVAAPSALGGGSRAPAPVGIAYYGENNTTGTLQTTTLDSSSLAGSLTVNQFAGLYASDDTPDMWGIQLNALLNNVVLGGVGGNQFWVQNAVDVFQSNDTIMLGEDTWNFTTASSYVPTGSSTILSHNPNGSVVAGIYIGNGPWIHTPLPFSLTLFLNSSVTPAGDQELWYNYSVEASGGIHHSGNYDWLVFNSKGTPGSTPIAPFVASGGQINPVGMPEDYELDVGIGPYNGATMDVLSANLSATLDYCPVSLPRCTPSEYRSVPAATDFGSQTGETSSGLSVAYAGTTATAAAGPFVLRGLWGYGTTPGSAAGSTAVSNGVTLSGAPDPAATPAYVFVFLSAQSSFDTGFEWAPDAPVWHLAPGNYRYEIMLADYREQTGNLTVGTTPTTLAVVLPYDPASGVYTPLWAFDNAELAGISLRGNGSLSSQYLLFNNPTSSCVACGGAADNNVSSVFSAWNDYLYPVFPGILLDGTTAYVDVEAPVNFCSFWFAWGSGSSPLPSACFYLQIELVATEHVTLAHDAHVGGWPAMFETLTLSGLVDASQNLFPTASVVLWNSSDDLVRANVFVGTPTIPAWNQPVSGVQPLVRCYLCGPIDTLLLYGGTNNTVWGNTFRDPTGPSGGTSLRSFAGLAEAESGDLLYNNNFSIDNPTVYLPFDIYTDACPMGYAGGCGPLVPPSYADRWNVSSQPAGEVSHVANGFSLSGSVLGPTCAVQGGNYWNDYGNALNPTSALPFTNVYDYSEIASLLPPLTNPNQNSIRVGGDFLPLTISACGPGAPIHFREVGLPPGTPWSLELAGTVLAPTTGRWINATTYLGQVPFSAAGPEGFGVARVTGHSLPGFGSVNVTGATTVTVHFGALETVFFDERFPSAFPGIGVPWSVTLTPHARGENPTVLSTSTGGTQLWFTLPSGARYQFVVSVPSDYKARPGKGIFMVPAKTLAKYVKIRPITQRVKFDQTTLPKGTLWYVNITGPWSADLVGTTSVLSASLVNGTYNYTVQAKGGPIVSGSFTVVAPALPQLIVVPVAPRAVPATGLEPAGSTPRVPSIDATLSRSGR